MPPSGHPSQCVAGQKNSICDEPFYSNQDISILCNIIIKAQRFLPEDVLPTRALFHAYFSTLEEYSVDPDHDNRFARILFKIGSIREKWSLYEKFKSILSRMEIGLAFERIADREEFRKLLRLSLAESVTSFHDNSNSNYLSTRRRRDSESSARNMVDGTRILPDKKRDHSFSTVRLPLAKNGDTDESTRGDRRSQYEFYLPADPPVNETTKIQRIRAWLASRPSNSRDRSLSSQASVRTRKESMARPRTQLAQESVPVSIDYHAASTTTALTSPFEEEISTNSIHSIKKYSFLQCDSLLDIKASLLNNRRFGLFISSCLQNWKNQALQLHLDNRSLEFIAANQYRKTVHQAVLYNWRIELNRRRKARDIEKYFNHLQGRATRARNLYLLYIAFSHWSNFTAERSQQSKRARNYIIRTKIFNAWRDITAVDEVKVRRQILKRYFLIFKLKYIKQFENNRTAIDKYDNDLNKRYFSIWKQEFMASRAFFWSAAKSEHSAISKFISKFHSLMQQKHEVEINVSYQSKMKFFRKWKLKTLRALSYNQKAELYHRHSIKRNNLLTWSKTAVLIPLLRQISDQRVSRLIKKSQQIWLHWTREEQKASKFDRLNILHEVWISWRHKTRTKVIGTRFDSQKIERALHKWILQARSKLAARLRNESCLRDMMYIWKLKWKALRKNHWDQETLAHEILARKTQNLVLLRWYSCMGNLQQAGLVAVNFYRPRISKALFRKWTFRLQHNKKLNIWSQDARYYLLALRILRQWKVSTENLKRNKRKMAYIQVRRSIKLNLVRRVLNVWLIQTQAVIDMQARATDLIQSRAIIIGMEVFDLWRSYAEESLETKILLREKSLYRYFSVWKNKTKQFIALEVETLSVYQERRTSKALNKWNIKYLNVRARTKYASDIHEKNKKRNFRRIFIFWFQRARDRILTMGRKVSTDQDLLGDIARNEAWSEMGEDNKIEKSETIFDGCISIASIPGYLNTPSKRSERIMAAAAKYSTTPKIPLPTLYERELRDMWSGGPNSSYRQKKLGKSRFGISESKGDHEL